MLGTRKNPIEEGWYKVGPDGPYEKRGSVRYKLPHGWLLASGKCFVPFAEDGTGWGKNDPLDLSGETPNSDPFGD